jgi:hypothetical protein
MDAKPHNIPPGETIEDKCFARWLGGRGLHTTRHTRRKKRWVLFLQMEAQLFRGSKDRAQSCWLNLINIFLKKGGESLLPYSIIISSNRETA